MCVAKYKNILDSIEKEKSEVHRIQAVSMRPHSASDSVGRTASPLSTSSTSRLSSLRNEIRSIGDDVSLTNSDVWDGEDGYKDVFTDRGRTYSQDDSSICSSLGSASDLCNVDDKPANFFGSEGGLNPPTVMQLNQAIDVSEQVHCVYYDICIYHIPMLCRSMLVSD